VQDGDVFTVKYADKQGNTDAPPAGSLWFESPPDTIWRMD